ncbi:M14 family metallopeptidase [Arenimonas sp.]|uniref:M14 family metallopeptidase n=1 Tax=Arenimonas sp. TaxID=1872635 RepID=UPI0039E5EC62
MPLPPSSAPLTRAESSDYFYTSRHADMLAFVDALRGLNDPRLHVSDFGSTPEGRALPLLVLSAHGHRTPEAAHASSLPVVLVINGIHAGEVEGKEASMMLVRDILSGHHGDLLERMTLVVVPLFNPDGNDRISPENRRLDITKFEGQLGPESGVGTRVNAAGINLNRDYMRQDGAEMRLLQDGVCHRWNAHLIVDCHATNGSIHRFDLTYDIPHTVLSGRPEPIAYMREVLLPAVSAAVKRSEGSDTFYYGNFLRDEGGQGMGWITYTHHPRFGGNYRGLTNRMDLLLETYSYIGFRERVHVTYAFLRETLRHVADHGKTIVSMLAGCTVPPEEIAVRYRLEAFPDREVEILTREPYTLDGGPIAVKVPYIGNFVAEHLVQRPWAYAVPDDIARKLEGHGLRVDRPSSRPVLDAEIPIVRSAETEAGRKILESNTASHLEAELRRERRALPEGWALVTTQQQYGAIAVYLCEAGSDDGLLACGWIAEPAAGSEFPAWRVLVAPDM